MCTQKMVRTAQLVCTGCQPPTLPVCTCRPTSDRPTWAVKGRDAMCGSAHIRSGASSAGFVYTATQLQQEGTAVDVGPSTCDPTCNLQQAVSTKIHTDRNVQWARLSGDFTTQPDVGFQPVPAPSTLQKMLTAGRRLYLLKLEQLALQASTAQVLTRCRMMLTQMPMANHHAQT